MKQRERSLKEHIAKTLFRNLNFPNTTIQRLHLPLGPRLAHQARHMLRFCVLNTSAAGVQTA